MANMNMIQALNSAMDIMLGKNPAVVIMGEDVGYFGGVFRATEGLQRKYGEHRVIDSPIAEGGIVATARDLDTDTPFQIEAEFIVGCDGARSLVRKAIDASLEGTPIIQRVQSTYIRAPKLLGLMGEPAWMTLSLNPRRCGTVVAIDGRETWLVHNHLNREDETFESVDRDGSIRAILGVGPEFEYEISCDQMCGRGHYTMRGIIKVVSEDEYKLWLAKQKPNYAAVMQDKAPAAPAGATGDSTKTTAAIIK